MEKPRVRFCWHCGKQLYGNHHIEIVIDEHLRILHKSCGKLLKDKIDNPVSVNFLSAKERAVMTRMDFYEDDPHKRKHGQKSVEYFGDKCEHLTGAWEDHYQGNISKKKRPWPPIISYCNHPDVKKEKPCEKDICPL